MVHLSMGHHYVPKKYLSMFTTAENPDTVWMFDKNVGKWSNAAISKVAQEPNFYDSDIEIQFNKNVERPGNLALEKLRNGEKSDEQTRRDAAVYIATMLERVPKRRSMTMGLVPEATEKVLYDVKTAIDSWQQTGADPTLVIRRKKELVEAAEAVRADPFRGGVIDTIRSPWASNRVLDCISGMIWRIGYTKKPIMYLTSDNPVHFFGCFGLGNQDSEFVFPLSTEACIFGSWRGKSGSTRRFDAPAQLVRESNRGVAHGAERFVFFPQKEDWVAEVATKERPYLSKINWLPYQ